MKKDYIYQDNDKYKLLQNAQRIGGFYAGDQGIVPAEQVLPEQRFAHQPIFRRPPEEVVKSKTYFSPGDFYLKFLVAFYGGREKSFIAKQEPTELAVILMKRLVNRMWDPSWQELTQEEISYLADYYLTATGPSWEWNGDLKADYNIILISAWAIFNRTTLVDGHWREWVYGAKLNGWNSFSIDAPFLLGGVAQNVDSQGFVGTGMIKPILLYKWVEGGVINYGLITLETRLFFVYDLPGHPEGVGCVESFLVKYQSVDFISWGKIEEIFIGSNYPLETRPAADKVGWLSPIIGQRDTSDYSTSYTYFETSPYNRYRSELVEALGESYKQALGEYLHIKKEVYGDFKARELGASHNFRYKSIMFSNRAFEAVPDMSYMSPGGTVVGTFSVRWGVAFLLNANDEIQAVNYPGTTFVDISGIPCPDYIYGGPDPQYYNRAFYSVDYLGQLKVIYGTPTTNPNIFSSLSYHYPVPLPDPDREIHVYEVGVTKVNGQVQMRIVTGKAAGGVGGNFGFTVWNRVSYLWVKRSNGATKFSEKYLDM